MSPEQPSRHQGDDVRDEHRRKRSRIRRHSARRHDRYGGAGARETDPDDHEIGRPQRRPERRLARTLFGIERLDVEVRADGRSRIKETAPLPLPGCGTHSSLAQKAGR